MLWQERRALISWQGLVASLTNEISEFSSRLWSTMASLLKWKAKTMKRPDQNVWSPLTSMTPAYTHSPRKSWWFSSEKQTFPWKTELNALKTTHVDSITAWRCVGELTDLFAKHRTDSICEIFAFLNTSVPHTGLKINPDLQMFSTSCVLHI